LAIAIVGTAAAIGILIGYSFTLHSPTVVTRSLCQQEGLTLLCNLHQVELAKQYSDSILGIQAGKLVLDVPTNPLSEVDVNRIYKS
jgi:phosphonate transport system ATP-binding protein